jgi:hypothetical protein
LYQPAKRQDLQDRERPDRVPALPTVRPRDQMPPNMGSHAEPNISDNDSNVKISRMVQDIEVVEHHMVCSSYTGLHEQAPTSTRSTRRTVVHTPLQSQGVHHTKSNVVHWPKTKEYNHSDCGDISCGGQNCKSTDAAGRACKCFRGRNHHTSRRVHGDYAGLHDHCECRPAKHLALAVNARF